MSDGQLDIQTRAEPGGELITLRGEIDMRCSPTLRAALVEVVDRKPQWVIMDLSGVTYIDSSGVGTLVEFKRKLERTKGRIVLAGMQERVRSVFEITKLDRFFALAPSVAEARKL
jgi:anti-anti-sigma factor